MTKKAWLAAALALAFGCKRAAPPDTLALVDGEAVTASQVAEELALQEAPGRKAPESALAEARAAALEELIDQALVLQEAARKGYSLPAGELENQLALARAGTSLEDFQRSLKERGISYAAWRERVRRRSLADEAVRREIRQSIVVKPQDLKDYYWEHVTQFRRPESVKLFQIFSPSVRRIEKAYAELELGEPFAEVAARHSESPEAAQGGELGWVNRRTLPAKLDQAAFALKKGARSKVLASHYGYHILYAADFRPAEAQSLDEAAPEIMQALIREREQPLYRNWLAGLRSRAVITRPEQPKMEAKKEAP